MTWRVVKLCELSGVDPALVCRSAGVSLAMVSDRAARVPYASADALLEAAAHALGHGTLALGLLGVVDAETYDAAGLLLLTGRTFLDGLGRAFAFQRLWGDGERFQLGSTTTEASVTFEHPGSSALANAICAELALLETLTAARFLVAADVVPSRVSFAHDAPISEPAALRQALGVEASFGAGANRLVFDRATVDSEIAPPLAWIQQALEGQAARALSLLPARATISARIEALTGKGPEWFELRLAEAAKRLSMSPRTLQRKLAEEGTSFDKLIDGLRRDRATRLLRAGATRKETAFLLGFADPSALVRARARWGVE
jgi:AraC-like DNA-binding protein